MNTIERFRSWYEYEISCDNKMLHMLAGVPAEHHGTSNYRRALKLADHLARGREKWLWYMQGKLYTNMPWWSDTETVDTLTPRFAALHAAWVSYLAALSEENLDSLFTFVGDNGDAFEIPVEVQLVQLMHHASYHRGQVVQLVDTLGAETVDTDYADYIWEKICAARASKE